MKIPLYTPNFVQSITSTTKYRAPSIDPRGDYKFQLYQSALTKDCGKTEIAV